MRQYSLRKTRTFLNPLILLAVVVSMPVNAQLQTDPADLEIRKSVDVQTPSDPLQPVEFLVEVEHVLGGPADDVVVKDPVPPELIIPQGLAAAPSTGHYDPDTGLWQVGSMEYGDIHTLTIPVLIAADPIPSCIFNRAELVGEDASRQNNIGVAALKRFGFETCVELEILHDYNDPEYCGNEGRVEFQLNIRNLGPDTPVNMAVTLEETSDFKLPGFKFKDTDFGCDGLRCAATISTGAYWQGTAQSEQFNNKTAQTHKLRVTVTVSGEQADTYIRILNVDQLIPAFSRACTDEYGVRDSSSGGCFIATAAYGTAMDNRIDVLRKFRDSHLIRWPGGQTLIGWYYEYSPPVADYIAPRPVLRGIVRLLLSPLIIVLSYPLYALAGLGFFVWVLCRAQLGSIRFKRQN